MVTNDFNVCSCPSTTATDLLSNLTSTTLINPILTGTNQSISVDLLSGPLAAPPGWKSNIINSNCSILNNTDINLTNTSNSCINNYEEYNTINTHTPFINNYEEFNTSNIINTSQCNDILTNIFNTSIDTNLLQQQSILTEQQQQNIINSIGHQQPPPLVIRKTLPNNQVTYKQNVSVRYLKPPPLPPPGPLIIREVRPPPPPPLPPLKITQRPPPPCTPPPLVLRERPPPMPPPTAPKVVQKLLPPPAAAARRVIVERFAPGPPKPRDLIIERWLPYKQTDKRRILVERAPPSCIPQREPNLLILYDAPQACVRKEFINQGVIRADPNCYLQQYGAELDRHANTQYGYLINEAIRAVPPSQVACSDNYNQPDYRSSYVDNCARPSSPIICNQWERTRSVSPIPRSSSYHCGCSHYDSSNNYCSNSSYRDGYDSSRYYDDYSTNQGSYLTMKDVTPAFNSYCRSSSYNPHSSSYNSCSSFSNRTIRVTSDNELRHVLSDLTRGQASSPLYEY